MDLHDPIHLLRIRMLVVLRDVNVVALVEIVLRILMPFHLKASSGADVAAADVARRGVGGSGGVVVLIVELLVVLCFGFPASVLAVVRSLLWLWTGRGEVCECCGWVGR